jgi:hypothetical protein
MHRCFTKALEDRLVGYYFLFFFVLFYFILFFYFFFLNFFKFHGFWLWTTYMCIHIHISYPLKFTITFNAWLVNDVHFHPLYDDIFFDLLYFLLTNIFCLFSSNMCTWINNNANMISVCPVVKVKYGAISFKSGSKVKYENLQI